MGTQRRQNGHDLTMVGRICVNIAIFTLPPIKEEDAEKIYAKKLSEKQSEKLVPSVENSLHSQDTYTDNSTEHCLLTEILKSTDECNKLKTRFEEEYINKEQAKVDLKKVIPENRYNFLMSRIDPLNTSIPTITKPADSNQSQPEIPCPATIQADTVEANTYPSGLPVACSYVPEVAFYSLPVVVDTYRLASSVVVNTYHLESRTIYPS